MRHPGPDALAAVLTDFRPDVLQTDLEDFADLALPAALERLPVLRAGRDLPGPVPARVLFEGPVSGAGVVTDWASAAALRARGVELVLAGGLDEHKIGMAIRAVQPWGVDVSSGVESAPGEKSAGKIARFVAAARAAHREN